MRWAPKDLIQRMIATGKDVINVPVFMDAFSDVPYDLNTWIESRYSMQLEAKMPDNFPTFEGYGAHPTYHTYLKRSLFKGRHLVPVDSVGGCILMVRADCHRQGLIFPTFTIHHGIETEGLAKMAKVMGFQPYALVDIFGIHGVWR